MVLKQALISNYLFNAAKTSDSRVFALKDCVNGIGTITALTGFLEYFFGKWTLYSLPKFPIGKPFLFKCCLLYTSPSPRD